ncbi:agmatine deiminase family protein [Flaviaesturariibacter aridisoli]|uniref:Agmatine deiminase family protein n=1 Tax=Flaviaesturariibacter aridisoli TaxID=2545761 RepID=A0A4R4DUZ7_9BACT|nr:agmatine deiminase family protein [Flaviaesturariibacter aridisoli]TCZ67053.1 hypothetical protein E0486_16330 [Flaviaesturariibacter aridisoli]
MTPGNFFVTQTMTTDRQTNFVYLADTLAKKYPTCHEALCVSLIEAQIPYAYIPDTRDVWVRDFMPLQVESDYFVQFSYKPDYLQGKEWQHTNSDVHAICSKMGFQTHSSSIVLDGGNVIKGDRCAFLCDKVFAENRSWKPEELEDELRRLFNVDRLIFLPWHKDDLIGHADGMLRLIDDHNVLINDFKREKGNYRDAVLASLEQAGVRYIELPFHPYSNRTYLDAAGIYMNFLHVGKNIFISEFGQNEDEAAAAVIQSAFPDCKLWTVKSTDVAKDGGVLNCISWTIKINT